MGSQCHGIIYSIFGNNLENFPKIIRLKKIIIPSESFSHLSCHLPVNPYLLAPCQQLPGRSNRVFILVPPPLPYPLFETKSFDGFPYPSYCRLPVNPCLLTADCQASIPGTRPTKATQVSEQLIQRTLSK